MEGETLARPTLPTLAPTTHCAEAPALQAPAATALQAPPCRAQPSLCTRTLCILACAGTWGTISNVFFFGAAIFADLLILRFCLVMAYVSVSALQDQPYRTSQHQAMAASARAHSLAHRRETCAITPRVVKHKHTKHMSWASAWLICFVFAYLLCIFAYALYLHPAAGVPAYLQPYRPASVAPLVL